MAREQRKYEKEYKVQAVKLAKEIGAGKAAKELGALRKQIKALERENRRLRACLKSFDKRRREADNKEKQAGVGGNASISK